MAFKAAKHTRLKFVCTLSQQKIKSFNYLENQINYENDHVIDNKFNKVQHIRGAINRSVINIVRKETNLKFYKTMAIPTLLYESEIRVLTKNIEAGSKRLKGNSLK